MPARSILAMMRLTTMPVTAVGALLATCTLLAQTPMKPTAPGTAGDPVWQGLIRANDGRTFVTDGGLVIDAALAKPARLPEREFPSKLLHDYFNQSHTVEYGLADLKEATPGKTLTSPNGIAMNATYINYLRRVLPRTTARLRMSEGLRPIVIVLDGQPVGAFMPVQQ